MGRFTIMVVAMLKSNMAATQKVSWSIFTDLSGYIFNIVGEESNGYFKKHCLIVKEVTILVIKMAAI